MTQPTRQTLTAVSIVACLAGYSVALAAEILGDKPKHLSSVSSVPNDQAIRKMIWAPGLDEAFVPQGLAFGEGAYIRRHVSKR